MVAVLPRTLVDLTDGESGPTPRQLAAVVLLSAGVHLAVMLALMLVRLPASMERPRSTYDVSLVTLPAEPPPAPPAPARVSEPTPPPAPAKPTVMPTKLVKPAPTVAPPRVEPAPPRVEPARVPPRVMPKAQAVPEPPPVMRKSTVNLKDALKDITLPPEPPPVGDVAPGRRTVQPSAAQDLQRMLNDLTVPPPTTAAPASRASPAPAPTRQTPAPALDPQLQRQLDQLQQSITRDLTAARPVVASKTPRAKRVQPMTAPDAGPIANEYVALVQRLISQRWTPPKIETDADVTEVVIRFRLNRDGRVTDVTIQAPSGNGYYDDAARRAVVSGGLPEFRPGMTEPHLDVQFRFSVGEATS